MTGQIHVRVRIDDPDHRSAGSLYRWLASDQRVRQDATVSLTPTPPGAGEMGGALEVIDVVLSNGVAVGGLLVAVASWRKARPKPPTVRIEGPDGVSVTIEDASPETVRRVRDALRPLPPDPGEGEADGAV